MAGTRLSPALQLFLFLCAFLALWTLRATVFYAVDESIVSPIARAAYSNLVKLVLWVLPVAVFAGVLRGSPPAEYLGLTIRGATRAMFENATGVFVFSILACWLFAKSASIWPSTVAHIANNMLSPLLIASNA